MSDLIYTEPKYTECADTAVVTSRLLKNWAARLTLEHESDSCAVERAAGGIDARFGYTDR